MVSEGNFNYTIRHGIFGLPGGSAGRLRGLINVGDYLLVYVVKRGCSELCESFTAVLEVAGGWRESGKPTWPDEVEDGVVKYPWVVDVKVVVKGRVSYSEVYSELTRLLPPLEGIRSRLLKAGGRVGFGTVLRMLSANASGKPVGSELCELIKARLQSMGGLVFSHEDVKGWLREVGELLGYHVVTEYESGGYRFDVAWWLWGSEGELPIAVFEVVIRGDVDKSIQRLLYAYRELRAKGLFLIVANNDDEARARNLIEGTYKELKGKVDIWYVDKVEELMNALSNYKNEIMKLATLGR